MYDIAIIGGGSGGLVVASSAAQLGLKVILIEKERLGGDCLWFGCVPSKALIESAKRIQEIGSAQDLGLPKVRSFRPSFAAVMRRMREVQAEIEPHDSPERFRKLGVDVRFGEPRFTGKRSIGINGTEIRFRYAVIATGSGPRRMDLQGLDAITNVELFSLKELPKRLTIIGGGPIGVEMGQAFARFGSKVTILARSTLLPKEDQDHVAALKALLEHEGISVREHVVPRSVEGKGPKRRIVLSTKKGKERIARGDLVLAAIGRVPNTQGLDLDAAGVRFDGRGVAVDAFLRTSNKRIFAIGDVIGGYQFTHMASSHATTVMRNIIVPLFKQRAETRVVPWVTYTDPELAKVGIDALQAPKGHRIYRSSIGENDRARTQANAQGEVKIIADSKGNVLGASVLGPHAGDLIMEFALAMKHKIPLQGIVGTIHPYPTLIEANKSAAAQLYKEQNTSRNRAIVQFLVRLR